MERLPDLIHWKRRRPAEDWRVSGLTQIYLRFGKSFPSIEICQFPFSSVTIQDFCIDLSNRSAGVKKKT